MIKLILGKMLILPVFLYGAEAWTLLNTDGIALIVFERKVLRKIFGTVRVVNNFHIRCSSEVYELLNYIDFVYLRRLGHAVRMEENAPARQVVHAGICESRRSRGGHVIDWCDVTDVDA